MPKEDRGWIQTYTGRQFWPFNPHPEDVRAEDIAHALSQVCRYQGHCLEFYSVAQHSVLVSYAVPDHLALWGLLHDAAEAYLADIARPLKHAFPYFMGVEEEIEKVIAFRFALPWPKPESVSWAD